MSRKISITSFIFLLLSSSSWANGFYLGAGAGPDAADFNQNVRVIVQLPGAPITSNVKDNTHLSGTGIFGTIFGGYGWSKKKFYLAGEINANISSLEFKSSNQEFINASFSHTNYRIQNSFGLSLLPGYLYTAATLFYARLGFANGYFKISTTDTSSASIHRNLNGFRYGLGVNHAFTPCIRARMEYSHINYQSTRFTVVDGAATKSTNISPETNQVEFSLIYDFA